MLTSELLISKLEAGVVVPKALPISAKELERAESLIALFVGFNQNTRGELDAALREEEGDGTDYRIRRGLAHLLYSERTEFVTQSVIEPGLLRSKLFAAAAQARPTLAGKAAFLATTVAQLSQELSTELSLEAVEAGLYGDLKENQRIEFEATEAKWLLERYNLAQAQGVLYRAVELTLTVARNDPGEYKIFFRYLKLFGLMHRIEGNPDAGFTVVLDGPASLFSPNPRYGLAFAKFLPALLLTSKWRLDALIIRREADGSRKEVHYTLDSSSKLQSHYKRGQVFDSILEEDFAERFAKVSTLWRLEREVELVDLGATVMIPDFRLVHPDGRTKLLEIVGFWRPDYLKKKFDKLRRAGRRDIIVAVSERLKLKEAGDLSSLEDQLIFFKGSLDPKKVLELAER
jgi:uncharacterized protein